MLQLFTVMLQAFGKLQIMGGLVSFAFHSAPKHSDAFEGCYWAFVGFLAMSEQHLSNHSVGLPLGEVGAPGCCDDGCGS